MSERIQLWSSGGGVQSAAIAVLILQGTLPKPDLCVIADTGREQASTWQYLRNYVQPAFCNIGLTVHKIRKEDWNAPDILAFNRKDILMPMFTDQNGKVGKMMTMCSTEWKQRPVRRFATQKFASSMFRVWMGMSFDEPRRIKPTTEDKWQNWYPLFEMRLTRKDCINLVKDFGWPEPPQSSCWMCPNRRADQWKEMSINNSKEFLKAVTLEEEIREHDPHVYLHSYGVPLAQAVLMTPPKEPTLFDTERCDSGQCFV